MELMGKGGWLGLFSEFSAGPGLEPKASESSDLPAMLRGLLAPAVHVT